MRVREASVSEPLMRCRKQEDGVKTGGLSDFQDESRGSLLAAWAAPRHKGGVNLIQAFVRNVGTYCMMRRENPISGGPTKGESIDAYSRGGPSRSSDEVLVMRMERRGWASSQGEARQPGDWEERVYFCVGLRS